MSKVDIVFSDFDGTLYQSDEGFHLNDVEALFRLGEKNVVRVLATGRSIHSVKSVIEPSFPIDYLIFSTGAGIMNWHTGEIIFSSEMTNDDVRRIAEILSSQGVTYMLHLPVPNNHRFLYVKSEKVSSDFHKRLQTYKGFYRRLYKSELQYLKASQFLCMLPNDHQVFESLSHKLDGVKVIKTSSPIGKNTLWLEVFPLNVSKGHAAKWLCDFLSIDHKKTMAVGNDYNDLDLLRFVEAPFVVENAPEELKAEFPKVGFQKNGGFSEAVNVFFK